MDFEDEHYKIPTQRCNNIMPTQSGYTKFSELPDDCGPIIKMEERGGYLWVESETGKKYRIDRTGKEVVQSNMRII